jgi:hypothetical protein
MSNIVGDIAIKVGADISPLVRDLGRASSEANSLGGRIGGLSRGMGSFKVASAAVAGTVLAVGAAMAALTKASMDNIDALSKQARQIGISVSSFQAMVMVAGEAGVEAGKLGTILVKMQDNIANLGKGSAAQVDAFRALGLSMSDLSGLGADEQFRLLAERISAIRDPVQKTALAMDVFGKSGADAINMLSGYGAAVDSAAAFQQRFGIAVSDLDAQNIEAANDAIGRLRMASEGLGNIMAATVAPGLASVANGIVRFIGNVAGFRVELEEFFGTLERARASLGEELFAKLLGDPALIREHTEALDDIVVEADHLAIIAATAAPQLRIFADELEDLGKKDAAKKLRDIADATVQARADLDAGKITVSEFNERIDALATGARAVVEEFAAINGADFSTAFRNIKTLTERLWEAARAATSAREQIRAAIFADSAAGQAMSRYAGRGTVSDTPVSSLFLPDPGAPGGRPRAAPAELGIDVPGKGGKGGGGKGDRLADELARLREYFAEESEVLALQYEERLAKIEEFRAAKLITEQEYNDLEAQAKEDHERKLAEIEAKFQRQRLGDVGDFFGSMAAIASAGGGKMVKAAAVFSAAQGLINSYTAYTEVLKDPSFVGRPFARFAAAGAVLASGLKMVSAIRGVGSSGGGGGAGAAAAQPATAPAAPLDVRLTGISAGDLFSGAQLSGLLDRLSAEAGDRGYKLMVAQ